MQGCTKPWCYPVNCALSKFYTTPYVVVAQRILLNESGLASKNKGWGWYRQTRLVLPVNLLLTVPRRSKTVLLTVPRRSKTVLLTVPRRSKTVLLTVPRRSKTVLLTVPRRSKTVLLTVPRRSKTVLLTVPRRSKTVLLTVPRRCFFCGLSFASYY